MDSETIKQMMELFHSLGANSKEAFVWWLIVSNVRFFLVSLMIFGVLVYLVRKILFVVQIGLNGEHLRRAAGVTYVWSESELKKACDILRTHFNK